jgi:protein-S-isoprenylcysteine O-methyltransferase Ste14
MAGSVAINGSGTSGAWSRRISFAQDAILILSSAYFCYLHVSRVLGDGVYTSVPFAIEQALLTGMFLFRRRSTATSSRPLDWTIAALGGWLPLIVQPHDSFSAAFAATGLGLQGIGLTITCVSFVCLGRSFGIVAANRGLKSGGPYRLVRHPIYLGHTLTITGFLLANFSAFNLVVYLVVCVSQLARIRAEERILIATSDYESYRVGVRWRLLPGVY